MLGLGQKADGLSIEESGIRYISLKKHKTWEIRKKRFLPLRPGMIVENQVADSEALLEVIKDWVKKQGLRGTKVSLTIPPSQIIIRKMTIPTTNDKQLKQLVKLEVETGLHLPFDNPVYDYVITGTDEDESQILVFAAPRKPIQDYIDIMEKAGLRISTVETSATALARSVSQGLNMGLKETMLIHLEHSMMDIYMFRSGNPVFIRTLSLYDLHQANPAFHMVAMDAEYVAEAAVTAEAVEVQLSPEQIVEITAEISRMLNFYQYSLHDGATRINNVLITGSEQLRKQLDTVLRQSLSDIEVTPISLEQLGEGAVPDPDLNSYRIAAGAALGSQESHIDLFPREDREAIIFPYIAIALVGIWLLGVIGTGIYFAVNKGVVSDQVQELQGLRDRGAVMQLELGKLTNSGVGQLDRKAAIEEILKYKLSAVAVLSELAIGLPQGGKLRDIVYTYRTSIELTTSMPNMKAASIYLAKLRAMSFTVNASIEKLSEGDNVSGSGDNNSTAPTYSAVYKVNMSAVKQQANATGASQEEVNSNGTNQ